VKRQRWYKSFYWRIAFGFVVFLAAMLVVQAMLYTWVVARSGRTLPGQSPNGFAQTVANDLANALERDPRVNLDRYVHDQYAQVAHPFFVMLADGTVINFGAGPISEPLLHLAHARLRRRAEHVERPGIDRLDPEWSDRSAGPGFRFNRPVPIVVNGQTAGVVVVPPRAPFGFLLRSFAPTLSVVAGGVLIVGTLLASVLIFGPARRRLRGLESAARNFGAGDLSARAPDRGGDEIASVAGAFNAMADDLAARAEALAASDRVRRQLLADVSHELTTPVTAMRGYLETLTMPELALDEATRARYLSIISDETARLERIIGDLLDLARLEGGGGSLTIERVSVAQLFDRVAARHERACQTAGVSLSASIEPGAEYVRGDRDRLEQALQNLAANAIRYAPRGSTLRLSAAPGGVGSRFQFPRTGVAENEIAIAVEDDGPGIPEEHLPRVFDRFYKADAARGATSSGSGLGLSIVKAIVERHGGHIAVSSVPGRTRFEIVLPNDDMAGLQDYSTAGREGAS
jgi:signal transduction histidine kinase